jgi:hypothetical protein
MSVPTTIPGPAATLPPGLIVSEEALLDPATRDRLAGVAPEATEAAAEAPAGDTRVSDPCPRCGWNHDKPPAWVNDEDRARLVEQLLFEGTYAKAFKLGPVTAVFRTLTSAEEDRCWQAAIAGAGAGVPGAAQAALTRTDYEFAAAVVSIDAAGRRYVAPNEITDPAAAWAAVTDYLKSGPIRSLVRNAHSRFIQGVGSVILEGVGPNF